MVNTTQIISKIETKIFDNLGSTAVLSAYTEGSLDKWGDRSDTLASTTSITLVPYNHLYQNEEFFDFGELQKGEVDIALKQDQSINVQDKITWNGKIYKVKAIQYYTLKDALLVKIIRLTESL